MKKRERTTNLVTESEVLENQNVDLKAQLKVKKLSAIWQVLMAVTINDLKIAI